MMDHTITVGDVLMVGASGVILALAIVAYAIISINMGWHR